jgi:phosphohistidine phosphatase SixA
MKTSGLLCLITFSALSAFGQPSQVILLRHAEKPEDEAALHLSAQGARRAQALAEFLGKPNAMTSNAPIAALYATRVTRHSHSQRTSETLAPLAKQLGLPVQTPYTTDLYSLLARDILSNRAYQHRTVVICWTHHDIAGLAAALGVRPKPPKWKQTVFDRFWVVRFENGAATLRDLPQGLLSGDANSSLFPLPTCSSVRLPLIAPCSHSQTKRRG